MNFNERDKDYFFALLENILKCLYIDKEIMTQEQKDRMKIEIRQFMESKELIDRKL